MANHVTNEKPEVRQKTNKKLIIWIGIGGFAMLILYLLLRNGPDLGQKALNEKRAKQKAAETAQLYSAKLPNPQALSKEQMAQAEQRQAAAMAAAASSTALPTNGVTLPPPTQANNESQLAALEKTASAVQAPTNYAGGNVTHGSGQEGSDTTAPFVLYQAPTGKDHILPKIEPPAPAEATSSSVAATHNQQLIEQYKRLAEQQQQQAALQSLGKMQAQNVQQPNGEGNEAWLYNLGNHDVGNAKPTEVETVKALYWLAPGTIIHGVIQNAINTSLPGTLTARVTENVYDSRYGRYLVIPAGSTLVGSYDSSVSDGQHRVMFGFNTLVTPSGGLVDLAGAGGTDALGRGGIPGDLHTRFWSRMAMTGLLAMEAVGMDRLNRPQTVMFPTGGTGQQALSDGGQIVSNFANRIMQQEFGAGPYITAPSGSPMTLILNKGVEIPPIANTR